MYIDDFFHSLTLLQPTYQFINEDFFRDKKYIQIISNDQMPLDIHIKTPAQNYLIYSDLHDLKHLYAYELDSLYHYINEISQFKITIPSTQAIYLEAGILEAIYLYDYLFKTSFKHYSTLLLPLFHLYHILIGHPHKNKEAYPHTYALPFLHQLYVTRFYYFIIQYCYFRFQCQQSHSLTHPYHFELLVENKLSQYLQLSPIHHIADLTYLNNQQLDDYISQMLNAS